MKDSSFFQVHVQDGNQADKSAGMTLAGNATQPRRQSAVRMLRAYGTTVLLVGSLAVIAAMGFLGFLWSESHRAIGGDGEQAAGSFWLSILDSGWIVRSITISSAVIRIAVAAQAGIATSMLASLIIEGPGVRPLKLAEVSILRVLPTAPHAIVFPMLRDISAAPFHLMLAGILLLTTVASQFSSTILLASVQTSSIVRNDVYHSSNNTLAFGYGSQWDEGDGSESTGTKLWNFPAGGTDCFRAAPQFPRFAEFKTPPKLEADGVRDTGVVRRAYLPLRDSARRNAVRQYSGPATVINTQVACVRPSVGFFNVTEFTSPSGYHMAHLQVGLDKSVDIEAAGLVPNPDFASPSSKYPTSEAFNCPLPLAGPSDEAAAKVKGMQHEWKMNLCKSNSFGLMLLDTLDLPPNWPQVMSEGQDVRRLFNWTVQSTFLFFNWTGSESDWAKVADDPPSEWTTSASGEWAQVRHSSATGPGVDLTYCVTNPLDPSYHIEAQSSSDGFEPQAQWQNSDANFGDSLDDILRQLGVGPPETDTDSRGILQMHAINEATDNLTYASSSTIADNMNTKKQKVGEFIRDSVMSHAQDPGYQLKFPDVSTKPYTNKEVLGLWQGVSLSWSGTHRLYVAVVQETMKRTRNPALAAQALFTMAAGSVYYADVAQYFDLRAPVSSRSSSGAVLIPGSWAGLVVVAVLVVVHIAATAVTTVLFLTRTRHAVIGGGDRSAWQAVAQVVSEDTMSVLNAAGDEMEGDGKGWGRWVERNPRLRSGRVTISADHEGRSKARYWS